MRYYRYVTAEHPRPEVEGEMTAFYCVDDAGRIVSSIELYLDGLCLAYDTQHPADDHGMLPDAEMDVAAAGEFGEIEEIDAAEFSAQTRGIKAANR